MMFGRWGLPIFRGYVKFQGCMLIFRTVFSRGISHYNANLKTQTSRFRFRRGWRGCKLQVASLWPQQKPRQQVPLKKKNLAAFRFVFFFLWDLFKFGVVFLSQNTGQVLGKVFLLGKVWKVRSESKQHLIGWLHPLLSGHWHSSNPDFFERQVPFQNAIKNRPDSFF